MTLLNTEGGSLNTGGRSGADIPPDIPAITTIQLTKQDPAARHATPPQPR
ncbi:hypothetical protein [Streptomyces phytophilus]|nr:hypothetical protein [Streptomyces phytophilus]